MNSIAGLLGNYSSVKDLPENLPLFAGAALIGAVIGTSLGVRLPSLTITRLLGAVLVVAGAKLIGFY